MSIYEKRAVIDMHTHILPKIDDGCGSSDESLELLRALWAQGVKKVVATPHFYASKDDPESFLERRAASAARLAERIDGIMQDGESECGMPSLYLGAEVEYFNAMYICRSLDDMCIKGTRYLLVEMPFYKWTSAMIDELRLIINNRGIVPIIAHIDRYFSNFNQQMLDELVRMGVIIQCNASAFLSIMTRSKVLTMLEEGKIHLLGSDCHNMGKRAPRIDEAATVIEKKNGALPLMMMLERGEHILEGALPVWSREGENI